MSTTTAPITATSMLYRFTPVTPCIPKAVKSHPPTTAPTTPSTMSSRTPSPALLTILLAMKPEISPRIIQPRIDMTYLSKNDCAPRASGCHDSPCARVESMGRMNDRLSDESDGCRYYTAAEEGRPSGARCWTEYSLPSRVPGFCLQKEPGAHG